MKKIKRLVDQIEEEICSAKDYAECYLDYKAHDDSMWANRYKEMAMDEIKHATYIHERAVNEIEELSAVYTPPEKMLEKWEHAHKEFIEKVAWIKQMLAM